MPRLQWVFGVVVLGLAGAPGGCGPGRSVGGGDAGAVPGDRLCRQRAPDGVAVWDIDPEHLAHAACKVAGRNVNPTE
jgi:hypothetical protein